MLGLYRTLWDLVENGSRRVVRTEKRRVVME